MDEIESDNGNYLVSFIDILGFSNLISANNQFPNLETVYNSIDRILHYLPDVHRTGNPNRYYMIYYGSPGQLPEYADEIFDNMYNFSDSIIFYIRTSDDVNEYVKQLSAICWISNAFIAESIIKSRHRVFQLPLRCGIAYGPACMNSIRRIHVGKPIVDAFYLCGSLDWVGGALHHSVNIPEEFREQLIGYDKQLYEYDDIPVKETYEDRNLIRHALNWVQQHPSDERWVQEMIGREPRPLVIDIGNRHVLSHDWGTETEKRDNTMDFVRAICVEFDERENIDS